MKLRLSPTVAQWAGPLVGLLLVVVIFSFTPGFLTLINARFILSQSVIVAICALGMTLIIVSGGIDLSVGSVVAFTGVAAAVVLEAGGANGSGGAAVVAAAFAAAVAAGVGFGALNGALIAAARINPFIVTLGMMGIARGASKWLAGNQTVNYSGDSVVNRLMNNPPGTPLWMPQPGVAIALVLTVVCGVVLARTVFGRHTFAIGSNESTARLCGIAVQRHKFLIYVLAGALYAVAGLLQTSRLQQGSPTVAVGLELDVIAAVVIGGASLNGGVGSVLGAVIGALIMACLRNGTQLMGWDNYVQEVIIGAVIILAVGIDRIRQSRSPAA